MPRLEESSGVQGENGKKSFIQHNTGKPKVCLEHRDGVEGGEEGDWKNM